MTEPQVTEPPRPAGTPVKVAPAKGRPMLSWVGKRPLREVRSFPAQLVERVGVAGESSAVAQSVDWSDWPERYERGGLLFHGDNKEVLAHLLANGFRGKVDLVYIDPPFDSGADYVRKVQLRGASGSARLNGETYTLGEQIQYTDIWANDTYLQFMYERLLLLKELLSRTGSAYLHVDWRRTAQLRSVMDEVFGPDNFLNEVIWHFPNKIQGNVNRFATNHNNIFLYAKSREAYTFHRIEEERDKPIKVNRRFWDAGKGQFATLRDADGRVLYTERKERIIDDVWVIPAVSSDETKQLDYPTQKPEQLLERAVIASSDPGDIVLDCFIGSGTTAAVSQKLGRRWIGADINKGAIQTTVKLLAGVMEEQAAASGSEQQRLLTDDIATPPSPAQLSFGVYRVNDYDLAIQHNEAVNLALQHLGVQRTQTDRFFDGVLGSELVKVVRFDHPATPLDLQAVAEELDARPDEQRNVVLVALGRENGCEAWLEAYGRHRAVNKIRLVELRTDPKYGRFFEHRPASARVSLEVLPGEPGRVRVRIVDFISPSILERLKAQEGVLSPQVDDWRAMVDTVMIDPDYRADGPAPVFQPTLIDIPEHKDDLVGGEYDVALPDGASGSVAVRITDMLGEDVLEVLSWF